MQTHGDLTPFPQPHYPGGSPSTEMTSWPGPAYNLDRTRTISPVHTSAPPHQADKLKADFKGEIIHACPAIPMFPITPWAEAQRHPGIPRSGLLRKPPAAAVTPTQHVGAAARRPAVSRLLSQQTAQVRRQAALHTGGLISLDPICQKGKEKQTINMLYAKVTLRVL